MVQMPTSLEIERAINLIRGFGWDLKKQEITETEITLTIVKKREVEIPPGPT